MKIRDIAHAPLSAAAPATDRWTATGTQARDVAADLGDAGEFPGWAGDAATTLRHRTGLAAGRVQTLGDAAATTAELLDLHCRALDVIQRTVVATIGVAESAGMTVHPDGRVTAGSKNATGIAMKVLDHVPGTGNAVDAAEAAFTVILTGAMATVRTLDAALAAKITGTVAGLPGAGGTSAEITPGTAGEEARSPGLSTEGVRIDAVLDESLTPELREEVLDIAEGAATELRARGLDPTEIPVTVTVVDGQLGTVIGDIDTAGKVTTLVAGTGSSDLGGLRDSAALAGRITGPGQATIAWHGYAAPESLAAAALSGRAESGGTALRGFQQQLRQRNPDARLSVVGHSYGTRVIDEAAGDGTVTLAADEIHLMGSPGMTADHASDLNLQATDGHAEVHVHKAEGDVIGLVADLPLLHGDDPADPDWGADFLDGEAAGDRDRPDPARGVVHRAGAAGLLGPFRAPGQLGSPSSSGPLGAPVGNLVDEITDAAGGMADGLQGLFDLDVGDEHGGYRTDGKVLEALRE